MFSHPQRIEQLAPHHTGIAARGSVGELALNGAQKWQQLGMKRLGLNLPAFDAHGVFALLQINVAHGNTCFTDTPARVQGNLKLNEHEGWPFARAQRMAHTGNLFLGKFRALLALTSLDSEPQQRVAWAELTADCLIHQHAQGVQIVLGCVVLNRLPCPASNAPVKELKGVAVDKLARVVNAAFAQEHIEHIPPAPVNHKRQLGIDAVLPQERHDPLLEGGTCRDIGQRFFLSLLLVKQLVRGPLAFAGAVSNAGAVALDAVNRSVFQVPERRIRSDIESSHGDCVNLCVRDRERQEQKGICPHKPAHQGHNPEQTMQKLDIIPLQVGQQPQQNEAVCAKCAFVPVGEHYFAIIEAADLHLLHGHKWYPHHSKEVVYAHSTKGSGGRMMHRIIMGLSDGDPRWVDHRDGDGLNNRRDNLRICTPSQNRINARKNRGTSKFKGVRLVAGRWLASIGTRTSRKHLGSFDTEEAAAHAVDQAAKVLYGEFYRPNLAA